MEPGARFRFATPSLIPPPATLWRWRGPVRELVAWISGFANLNWCGPPRLSWNGVSLHRHLVAGGGHRAGVAVVAAADGVGNPLFRAVEKDNRFPCMQPLRF